MAKSILQTKNICYLKNCKCSGKLETHHTMNGNGIRKLSEQYGLKVMLCQYHHTMGGKDCVHENAHLRTILKMDSQKAFEDKYGHDKWMEVFRKDYLQ